MKTIVRKHNLLTIYSLFLFILKIETNNRKKKKKDSHLTFKFQPLASNVLAKMPTKQGSRTGTKCTHIPHGNSIGSAQHWQQLLEFSSLPYPVQIARSGSADTEVRNTERKSLENQESVKRSIRIQTFPYRFTIVREAPDASSNPITSGCSPLAA